MRAIASRSAARKIDKKTNTLESLEEVRRRNGFQVNGVFPKGRSGQLPMVLTEYPRDSGVRRADRIPALARKGPRG
jgi:hypothetical protein